MVGVCSYDCSDWFTILTILIMRSTTTTILDTYLNGETYDMLETGVMIKTKTHIDRSVVLLKEYVQ